MKTRHTLVTALFIILSVTAFANTTIHDDKEKTNAIMIAPPQFVWGEEEASEAAVLNEAAGIAIELPDFAWGDVPAGETTPVIALLEFVWGIDEVEPAGI